jgi:hypothetical protein
MITETPQRGVSTIYISKISSSYDLTLMRTGHKASSPIIPKMYNVDK